MWNTFVNNLIPVAFTLLSSIVTGVLLPLITQWITSKITNVKFQTYITDIEKTVATTVDDLTQRVVAQAKEDGKWDAQKQSQVLDAATHTVYENLLTTSLDYMNEHGLELTETIHRHIEAYIQSKKGN